MASLGAFVLLAAFVTAAYAASMSVAGARRRSTRLIESGIGALYFTAALMTIASGVIVHAFVAGDYRIRYVHQYSDTAQPLFYKLTSYWGGLDGSILFWVFLLSVFGALAVRVNRERHRELIPYVVATIAVVEMFFLFLMIIHRNPFETYLTQSPVDGRGLNPLLQNPYMVVHPPSLYIGFVGMTIPFAFCIAALITGYLDDAWLRAVRRWTMVSWLFLSLGLMLGMIWAYEELGWGGIWMWDPVENAGLLPWFPATAFLHSVIVQERRSMLRVWNVALVIVAFFLTIFATFMTRSGVVQSVHAFGEDRELAMMFTIFMVAIIVFSFGLVIWRLPLLRSRNELDSWISREAAFLVNNWILLFAAVFVLFATMFPTLSEAVTGERLTVGPPFFNKWMTPIGFALLFLTGAAPLVAWRKSSLSSLRQQFLWPTVISIATGAALVALGVRVWTSGICFVLCAFVAATIVQEFLQGARVRQQGTGTDLLTALIGLVGRNKRRYGGYIVHLGIVLIFLGIAGEGFKREEQVLLRPGQQTIVGPYTIRLDAIRITEDPQKQAVTGHLSVFEDGRELGKMYPAKWFFRKHEEEPTTEVAIRRGVTEDLYLIMPAFDVAAQSASLHIMINPLVNWIWVGFGILALGTGIALLPERTYAFAVARLPAEAATTSAVLLLLVSGLVAPVRAQSPDASTVPVVPRSELERRLEGEILCTCGCRRSLNNCGMTNCRGLEQQMPKLKAHVASGKSYEEIIQAFVDEYGGQHILAAPLDRGFNRLAWFVPYALGIGGLAMVAVVARRWSRRRDSEPEAEPSSAPPLDRSLEARLDDELRDLE
ncbi:MAG TPA: cytochrome c-type biogenesis CcmF C-terminal domain-containing protein [Vicinamibacterales bacterium]|nr:cytochrome c-type biogenesis CcmF C-terminal domain-containing protein [Vicinamibacterales bacterium]